MAPCTGPESPTSNSKQLDGALRHSHIPTTVLEKARAPKVYLHGVPIVISFCRDLHDVNITETMFSFCFYKWGWVLSLEFSWG